MSHLPDELLYTLFASDLAQDVRAEFSERRGYGLSVADATGATVAAFRHLLGRPDEGPVVIVALAALQLRDGALDATFREAAIDLLREGHDFQPRAEENPSARRDRQRLRQELLELLERAEPAAPPED